MRFWGQAARRRKTGLSGWVLLGFSLASLLYVCALFLDPATAFHPTDEGILQAIARRMVDGRMLPYVDAVSHRGPMHYWFAASVSWVLGADSWVPMRVCWLLASAGAATFCFLAGREAGESYAGGFAAFAGVFVSLLVLPPFAGLAHHAELLVNAFGLAALWLVARGVGRAAQRVRGSDLFFAGCCAALAALSKHNAITIVAALGVWVVIVAIARPGMERKQRTSMVVAFAAGVLLPPLVILVRYALAGELSTLYYYLVTYNLEVYMARITPELRHQRLVEWLSLYAMMLVAGFMLIAWGLTRPAVKYGWRATLGGWARDGFIPTVALGALLGLLASNLTLRDFSHYYLTIVPWFGLLLGLALDAVAPSARRRRAAARLLVALPLVVGTLLLWSWREPVLQRGDKEWRVHMAKVCAIVDKHSAAEDPLFVWGFSPDLYTWCDRRPASRYVITTFVAGFVPWWNDLTREEEDALAVPGSREELLAELEQAKPPVIVDPASKRMSNRQMTRYPVLARYLQQRYCPAVEWDGIRFYRRRASGVSCPTTP